MRTLTDIWTDVDRLYALVYNKIYERKHSSGSILFSSPERYEPPSTKMYFINNFS